MKENNAKTKTQKTAKANSAKKGKTKKLNEDSLPPKSPNESQIQPTETSNLKQKTTGCKLSIEMESIILKKGVKVHLPIINKPINEIKPLPNIASIFVGPQPCSSNSVDSVKRELFQADNESCKKIKITSNVLLSSAQSKNEFRNQIVNNGMCYDCTFNITINKKGISCKSCSRTFHVKCARENCPSNTSNTYFCNTCQKNMK